MPHVYALAASPVGQAVLQLSQEEVKTKGFRALFAVILMFVILCGGVWMLLQSSFGPKQAYLVTGTAFFGCWLVLSLFWLAGVPGTPSWFPVQVPRSTPQYYGPQGSESTWELLRADDATRRLPEDDLFEATEDITNQAFLQEKAAAETAASEAVPGMYAAELGVGADEITIPNVIEVEKTEVVREGGRLEFARVTFGPAQPNASSTETAKELIAKIKPKAVDLYFQTGTLARPTYISIALFALLFLGHLLLLALYEVRNAASPKVAPVPV